MNQNNIYLDNLRRFQRFCPEASKKLETLDCSCLEFCQTAKGELNLKKQIGSQTYYYHAQDGALNEAKAWFEAVFPIGTRVLCIYGIGLGYYYDALVDWLRSNPSRFIVFIEDDLAVIKRFLETSKASTILTNTQVVIQYFDTPGEKGWGKFRKEFAWFCDGFAQSPVSYQALKLYENLNEHMYRLIKQQLIMNMTESNWDLVELFSMQELVCRNFYHNLPYVSEAGIAESMKDHFPNVPMIISGAGPSLNKHFELLRSIRDKAILLGSGTAMNTLTRNGIMPHFGFCVDPYDVQESRYMTNLAYEVPFFYANRFYYKAFHLIHGPKIYISTGYGNVEKWLEKEIGLPNTEYISGGISTTNVCCNLAGLFGANPIVLIGLDMAYTDSSRYADGVTAHPSDQRYQHEDITKIRENTTVPALGVHGQPVQTRWDWIIEASHYTEFSQKKPYLSLINATEGGLGILEVPNLALKDIVKNRLTISYDIQNWIHCEIEESRQETIEHDKVIDAMEKWQVSLGKCRELCLKMLEELQKMTLQVTEESEIPNLAEQEPASSISKDLRNEEGFQYLIGKFENKFESLAATDMNKLKYFPDQFFQKQKVLIHLEMEKGRHNFFKNLAEIHLQTLIDSLKDFRERLSKQKEIEPGEQPKTETEGYQFQGGVLSIRDPELEISHEETFEPEKISEERKKAVRENPREILTIKPGIFEGQALLLYPEGTVKGEFFYIKGQLHGPSTFYSRRGNLLAQSWFLNGVRIGKSRQFYADGSLYSLQRYNAKGQLHGKQEYYYPTGILKTVMNYSEGLLNGELKLYYPSGQIKREQNLVQGKLHGKESVWSEEGKQIIEAEFKMNLPTGKTTMWYANGQIAKEITFYDHPMNFRLFMWDKQGKLIHQQTSLPDNFFDEMLKKSEELQKSIQEAAAKLIDLKKQSETKNE